MKLTRKHLNATALLLLSALLLGASVQHGSGQSADGRMRSRRAVNEETRARQAQAQYMKRERQALNRRVAELERQNRAARAQMNQQKQHQTQGWSGNTLQTFQQRCGGCHSYPDGFHATDRAWLDRVRATQCSGMPPDPRERLARYLSSVEGLQPRTVAAQTSPDLDQGTLSCTLRTGEVLLRHEGGPVYRLVWGRGEEGQRRALPAGNYQFLGYRVLGGTYHSAGTGGRRTLSVSSVGNLHLPVDTGVAVELTHQRKRAQVVVTLLLRGQDGMGVGLYHGGASVPIPVVVLAGEDVVTEGALRSVGTGRYRATLAVPESLANGRIRVELPPDLPFKARGATAIQL